MNQMGKDVVIISGCASGIGHAMTAELLEAGYQVLGVDKQMPSSFLDFSRFRFAQLDLADIGNLTSSMKTLLTTIEGPIRGFVSNAGIGRMGFLEQLSVADLKLVMDTNFLSHAVMTKAILPVLKQQDSTSDIVYTGSEAALKGSRQGSVYCASKFALRGFSQALREECAKSSVRVTLLNPGAVRTPFFDDLDFEPGELPENAIEPEDVAKTLLYVLEARPGTVIEEVNLSPLTHVWRRK